MGRRRSLRVALVGVRVQEAHRYYVELQLLPPPYNPPPVFAGDDMEGSSVRRWSGRTESTEITSAPDFRNRAFTLLLPTALDAAAEASAPAGLRCLLYAAARRPVDGPAEEGRALGNTTDELLASGLLPLEGYTVPRLLRGERVTSTVALAAADGGLSSRAQVNLELMLLDADTAVPSSADSAPAPAPAARRASMAPSPPLGGGRGSPAFVRPTGPPRAKNSMKGGLAASAGADENKPPAGEKPPPAPIKVRVLVSRAEGLPMSTDASGVPRPPAAFVAAKSQRDANAKLPSKSSCSAVVSCDPLWGEVVEIEVAPEEVEQERVHLAIVDQLSSKLIAKGSLPLSAMTAGHHYNLKLLVIKESKSYLYVTVVIPRDPRREQAHLHRSPPLTRILATIKQCSAPAFRAQPGASAYAAVWRLVEDAAVADAPSEGRDLFREVDVSRDDSDIRLELSKAGPSQPGGGERVQNTLPVLSRDLKPLWDDEHGAPLLVREEFASQPGASLVMELHRVPGGPGDLEDLAALLPAPAPPSPRISDGGPGTPPWSPPPSPPPPGPPDAEGGGEEEKKKKKKKKDKEGGGEVEATGAGGEEGEKKKKKKKDKGPLDAEGGGEEEAAGAGGEDGEGEKKKKKEKRRSSKAAAQAVVGAVRMEGSLYEEAAEGEGEAEGADGEKKEKKKKKKKGRDSTASSIPEGEGEGGGEEDAGLALLQQAVQEEEAGTPGVSQDAPAVGSLPLTSLTSTKDPRKSASSPLITPHQEHLARTLVGRAVIALDSFRRGLDGAPVEVHAKLQLAGLDATATIVLRTWSSQSYLEALEGGEDTGAGAAGFGGAAAEVGEQYLDLPPPAPMFNPEEMEMPMNGGAVGERLDLLFGDMQSKQAVVERLVEETGALGLKVEGLEWRLAEETKTAEGSREEVAHLRRLLHEEKEAQRVPPSLKGAEAMTPEQLRAKANELLLLQQREARRNEELSARLSRVHSEVVQLYHMKARYEDLQEAHAAQSTDMAALLVEMEAVEKFKATITAQEGVIARMEALLKERVGEHARLVEAEAKLEEMAKGIEVVKDETRWEQMEALRQKVVQLEKELQDKSAETGAAATEQGALLLRAEGAEARANAAQNELLEANKRFAREMAHLKMRLAEKDAQLMGGFGAVSNMALGGAGLGGKPPRMGAPSPRASFAAGGRAGSPHAPVLEPLNAAPANPMRFSGSFPNEPLPQGF